MTTYPRIEVYSEVDLGDPYAGNQKWDLGNGKFGYGGAADYRPHIRRRTYHLDELQRQTLMALPLRFLPYFGLEKPAINFGDYAQALGDKTRLAALLPPNLEVFYALEKTVDFFEYFETLLLFERGNIYGLTIVWLDEQTWFLNQVYYDLDLDKLLSPLQAQEDLVAEGRFSDFMRLSPLVQAKLSEGISALRVRYAKPALPLDAVVLGAALSPGMPNTTSYYLEVWGDGTIYQNRQKTKQKLDPHQLANLLLAARHIGWESHERRLAAQPLAHDAQQFSIQVWVEGRLYRLNASQFGWEGSPVWHFVQKLKAALGLA